MNATTATAWDVAARVPDPEIPFVNIAELGILRSVEPDHDGGVTVTITPTYSGCPAMKAIEQAIVDELAAAGYDRVRVETVFAPAWSTDWMTDDAREKLERYGIAPPATTDEAETAEILCPSCASQDTRVISPFGSTACKALMVCSSCGEPFDHFKTL